MGDCSEGSNILELSPGSELNLLRSTHFVKFSLTFLEKMTNKIAFAKPWLESPIPCNEYGQKHTLYCNTRLLMGGATPTEIPLIKAL